jgi:hypothetical protein
MDPARTEEAVMKHFMLAALLIIGGSLLFSCSNVEGLVYNPDVARSNLVLEMLFAGNADDTSGNANHGTVNGAELVTDRFGRENQAYSFNSAEDDHIVVPDDPTLNPIGALSVTLWVKGSLSLNGRIISKRSGLSGWEIDGYEGVRFTRNGTIMYKYTASLPAGQWVFVAMTWEPNSVKFYINGDFVIELDREMYTVSTTDLFLGIYTDGTSYPFEGEVDDIRLYDEVLTSAEIDTLYHAGDWDL